MKTALICIDYINEMVDQSGKLSGKGYFDFVRRNGTLGKVAQAQKRFRLEGNLVIHVRIGFSPSYVEHPGESPLLGKAKEFNALQIGAWGTQFVDPIAPRDGDVVLTKHRISAFFNTALETTLSAQNINKIYLVGVSTDLAIQSTALDAHDRDYDVTIIEDCCAAANDTDHVAGLASMRKFASVAYLADI